ncbi:hypothetical protein P9112_014223 [Eukaryota sp. TZLM1-RC]
MLWFHLRSTNLFLLMDSLAKVSLDVEDIEFSVLQTILNNEIFSLSFDRLTTIMHLLNLQLVELSQNLNAKVNDLLYSAKISTTDTQSGFTWHFHSVGSLVQQYLANFGNSDHVVALIDSTSATREVLLNVQVVVLKLLNPFQDLLKSSYC